MQIKAHRTVLLTLLRPVVGPTEWPELTPVAAGGVLGALLLGACALVSIVFAALGVQREKNVATPWLRLLAMVGILFIFVGVLHNLLGALIGYEDALTKGLWSDRTAFPTAMTAVGGTLIGFAGLAWSLNSEQRARDRRQRKQELNQLQLAVDETVKRVNETIQTCNQLAIRGINLVVDHLPTRIASTEALKREGGSSTSSADQASPRADAWFEVLFSRRSHESWEWASEWANPDCPETTKQLIEVVGHRFHDPEEWRATRQFVALVEDTAVALSNDARLWLEEYLDFRKQVSGITSDVPIDLLPFVDDLEFVRDLVQIGSDIGEARSSNGTSLYFVTLATIMTLLSQDTSSLNGATDRTRKESKLEEYREHLRTSDSASMDFSDKHRKLWYAAFRGSGSWMDLVPSDVEAEEQDALYHIALSLLAGIRRRQLQDLIDEVAKQNRKRRELDPDAKPDDVTTFWRNVENRASKEKRVALGMQNLRRDFPRVRWPQLSAERGVERFVELYSRDERSWSLVRRGSAIAEHGIEAGRRRTFDWSTDEETLPTDLEDLGMDVLPYGQA